MKNCLLGITVYFLTFVFEANPRFVGDFKFVYPFLMFELLPEIQEEHRVLLPSLRLISHFARGNPPKDTHSKTFIRPTRLRRL